jgi:hypothetical protein
MVPRSALTPQPIGIDLAADIELCPGPVGRDDRSGEPKAERQAGAVGERETKPPGCRP